MLIESDEKRIAKCVQSNTNAITILGAMKSEQKTTIRKGEQKTERKFDERQMSLNLLC